MFEEENQNDYSWVPIAYEEYHREGGHDYLGAGLGAASLPGLFALGYLEKVLQKIDAWLAAHPAIAKAILKAWYFIWGANIQ